MASPLNGIKVLDLTRVLAGPYATMLLGDLGAEVIKIEQPGTGDESRNFGPFKNGFSLYFMSVNRGKRSVTLNLKTERGRAIFKRLLNQTDILVENFRPGTMEKLGLSYDTLKSEYPSLIYAACSGFGQTGPYAQQGAYDMIIQGMGGIISITGEPDRPPVRVGTSISDITAALFTTIGILSALHHRNQTGKGQFVDVAMLDSLVAVLENAVVRYFATGEAPKPLGARHPAITPFEAFASADGHVIIALGNDTLWSKFCEHVGRQELISDKRFRTNADRTENHDQLFPILSEIMSQRATDDWIDALGTIGVPCGPINAMDKVVTHPQVQAREMITRVAHKITGEVEVPGVPIKLSETPGSVDAPAPSLGEHTVEVLTGLLKIDTDEIEQLRQDGII
ncbi:CoA transferase [Candidatus Poribacteria bacterium]|nr:CaiB/BaiF CoA-transferase family protein [Candidatus Poribacteria bacterium]MXY26731.1 CoA transferase [Candidatus Poribacteria bacterium]MYK17139.1 CoA transferase [Candidatus Poribacteria bacterium]